MRPRSMDDLPDVSHTFEFCVDLAELLVPEVLDESSDLREILNRAPEGGEHR